MAKGSFSGFWHIMRAFYDGDAYLALPFGVKFIDEVVSNAAAEYVTLWDADKGSLSLSLEGSPISLQHQSSIICDLSIRKVTRSAIFCSAVDQDDVRGRL